MTYSHDIGLILPKIPETKKFTDIFCNKFGIVLKQYINTSLGDAFAEISSDGYVVKNVFGFPADTFANIMLPSLPALYVYRDQLIREKFTMTQDYMVSTIFVDYIINSFY
jgi:hypothetical protein